MDQQYGDLGSRLRQLRKQAGITQQELAKRAGLGSYQTVQKLEKGERPLTLPGLFKLAQALGYRVIVEGQPRLAYLKAIWGITGSAPLPKRDATLFEIYQQAVELVEQLQSEVMKSLAEPAAQAPFVFTEATRVTYGANDSGMTAWSDALEWLSRYRSKELQELMFGKPTLVPSLKS